MAKKFYFDLGSEMPEDMGPDCTCCPGTGYRDRGCDVHGVTSEDERAEAEATNMHEPGLSRDPGDEEEDPERWDGMS